MPDPFAWLRRNRRPQALAAASPDEVRRVYAVGDIHGRLDLLTAIAERIEADLAASPAPDPVVVFLGDYVDRGPQSRGVIDFLVNEPIGETDRLCLKGNHEAIMLAYLEGRDDGEVWCANGAIETMESYGVVADPNRPLVRQLPGLRDRLGAVVPDSHRVFLRSLDLHAEIDGNLYVHAGVRPGVPLESQSEHDLLWIRDEFHRSKRPIDRYVVHGHTPVPEPLILPHRADIDTGAWTSGRLTCLVVEGANRRLL